MAAVGKRKAKPTKWRSSPPELVARFERALRRFPEVEPRKLFGYPAAFVNGNMMAGLFQDSMMLRMSARDLARLQETAGATRFEPTPGRVMREYTLVPRPIVESDARLRRWLGHAFDYVSSLPAKAAKPRPAKRRSTGRP